MGDPLRPSLTADEQLFVQALAAALIGPFPGQNAQMFMAIGMDALDGVDHAHQWLGPIYKAAVQLRFFCEPDAPLSPRAHTREDHNMAILDLRHRLADFFAWRAGLLQDAATSSAKA